MTDGVVLKETEEVLTISRSDSQQLEGSVGNDGNRVWAGWRPRIRLRGWQVPQLLSPQGARPSVQINWFLSVAIAMLFVPCG
jgi:hypothetical protein